MVKPVFHEIEQHWSMVWLFAPALLILLIVMLYGHSVELWWSYDDSQVLKHASQFHPWEYFFVSSAYQKLSGAHLTPWVSFSFDFDLWLAALDPYWFYLHQLISLIAVAFATFLLLRQWIGGVWAFLGAVLFVNGSVVVVVMHQVMTRHYLEGLLFCILALHLYCNAQRHESLKLAWLGALFYLLATSAKEIYVPLIVLLPMLTVSRFRLQWRYWLPYVAVAVLYTIWRRYMLGVWVGGYTASIVAFDWQAVVQLPLRILERLFGNEYIGLAASITITTLFFHLVWSLRSIWPIVIIFLLLLPLIPMSSHVGHFASSRVLLLIWWSMSVAVVFSLYRITESHNRWIAGAAAFLIGYVIMINLHSDMIRLLLTSNQNFESPGRPVLEEKERQAFFFQENARGLMELAWLRENVLGFQPHLVMYDKIQVSENLKKTDYLLVYNKTCLCFQNSQAGDILRDWETRFRKNKPLSVLLSRDADKSLTIWEFGPYKNGSYYLIDNRHVGKTILPASGGRRIIKKDPLVFRVRYDSPEGWITYSPILRFEWQEGEELKWSR